MRSTWTQAVDRDAAGNVNKLQILLLVILTAGTNDKSVLKVVGKMRSLGWFSFDKLAVDDLVERAKLFCELRHRLLQWGFNFYNQRAAYMMGACYPIKHEFDEEVLDDFKVEDFFMFPGVDYKVCMLYYDGIGEPKGVAADRHVIAGVLNLELVASEDAYLITKELESLLPTEFVEDGTTVNYQHEINYVIAGLRQLYQQQD